MQRRGRDEIKSNLKSSCFFFSLNDIRSGCHKEHVFKNASKYFLLSFIEQAILISVLLGLSLATIHKWLSRSSLPASCSPTLLVQPASSLSSRACYQSDHNFQKYFHFYNCHRTHYTSLIRLTTMKKDRGTKHEKAMGKDTEGKTKPWTA